MQEVSGWFESLVAWHRQAFLDLSSEREPDDALPKMLVAFWMLIILCVCVCTAFGVAYHYAIFKSVTGSSVWAMVAACTFLVIVEITTVFFGLYFFDAILDKLWFKNMKRLVLVLGVGAIVTGAFMWSINISTKGVSEVNKSLKSQRIFEENKFVMPAEVAEIDRQIAELEKAKNAGAKATWKKRTTREGLEVIQSNTDLHATLLAQRSTLIESAKAQHDQLQGAQLQEASFTSELLTTYGGKAEYAKLASLFFVSLIGSILRDKHRKAETKKA